VLGWVGGVAKIDGVLPSAEAVRDRLGLITRAVDRLLDGERRAPRELDVPDEQAGRSAAGIAVLVDASCNRDDVRTRCTIFARKRCLGRRACWS
jgi:hypothetical protein